MRSASTASETSKQCLHLPCLSAPLQFQDAASDREPRREPRCALCGNTIARRERGGRSQMRPAQAWSPRRSNWSNPKSQNLFCPHFSHSRRGRTQRPFPARRGAVYGLSAFRCSSGSLAKLSATRRASSGCDWVFSVGGFSLNRAKRKGVPQRPVNGLCCCA